MDLDAFWIAPNGKVVTVNQKHIQDIIDNPKTFGLTSDYVLGTYKRFHEPIGMEGKAREEIMLTVLKKGWVRCRKRSSGEWILQVQKMDNHTTNNIWQWVLDMRKNKYNVPMTKYTQINVHQISNNEFDTYEAEDILKGKGIFESKKTSETMVENETDIVESPDTGYTSKGAHLTYDDTYGGARPFGYWKGTLCVGEPGETHYEMEDEYGHSHSRWDYKYAGRIWTKYKLISFWHYPTDVAMYKKVILDLERSLRLKIWNDPKFELELPETEKKNTIQVSKFLAPKVMAKHGDEGEQHVKSPMLKGIKPVPAGVGSKKTVAGMTATPYHQTRMTSDGVIKENPDYIRANGGGGWSDRYAHPFGFWGSKFYVGGGGTTHWTMFNKEHMDDYINGKVSGDRDKAVKLSKARMFGRIWTDKHVISFWQFPWDRKEFVEVAKQLEQKLHIKILDNAEYVVEEGSNKFTPATEYLLDKTAGGISPDIGQKHVMSPVAKGIQHVPAGLGSKKTVAGMTATPYHQTRMTSDGIIKEDPDSLSKSGEAWSERDARPFGYWRGKFYVSDRPYETHWDLFFKIDNDYQNRARALRGGPGKLFGRIFLSPKVITFWQFPKTRNEFEKLVKHLESDLHRKILSDPKYKVEALKGNLVAIDKYLVKDKKGGQVSPNLGQQHVLSPMAKGQKPVPPGLGSKKTVAGLTATPYFQKRMTSDGVIKTNMENK